MRSYLSRPAGIAFFLGVLGLTLVAYGASHKASEKHDHATHQHNDICAGFVVLPTGYVVLSAIDPSATSGMKHDMHHGKAHGDSHGKSDQQQMTSQKDMAHTSHMQHGAKTTEATDPLMGYKHGDDVLQSKDRLVRSHWGYDQHGLEICQCLSRLACHCQIIKRCARP